MLRRLAVLVVLSLATVACGGGDDAASEDSARPAVPDEPMPAPSLPASVNDAGALAIVGLINSAEIDAGDLAMASAQRADVKQFAQEMSAQHTAMKRKGDTLAMRSGIRPSLPPGAEQLQATQKAMMDSLLNMPSARFDSAYVESQIAAHRQALVDLRALASQAQNAQLKAMIEAAIPAVQQHLDRALALRSRRTA